ncbi:MAG: hypothetical protein JO257_23050 [Deltaproteobacteria bacterium]|nr:hypothetical protein [Deltaproteobacteria bacterium]
MARRRSKHLRLRIAVLAVVAGSIIGWSIYSRRQPGSWQHVFATREGMVGSLTSSRTIIHPGDRFVALPDRSALHRDVEVRYRGRVVVVPCLDVGPWNVDDPYWKHDEPPASERGRGAYRTPVNKAGIDLSDAVFAELGLTDNDYVDWRFVHRDYVALPFL